jgi:pimeloyl-ACP methyl ester carboxylesterase
MMSYLELPGGATLAYRRREGCTPGVMFLGGFMSDMSGRKALALEAYCRDNRRAFVAFDYRGHGLSSGRLEELGVDSWIEDSLMVLDTLTDGAQILVGSSMGAWLLTLCLQRRPQRIGAALGLGAAPDFIDAMIDTLDAAQMSSLARHGYCELPTRYADRPYRLTQRLIDSARAHNVLGQRIDFPGPVRLLHGLADEDVPWPRSIALAGTLSSPDLEVRLVAGGDHRLSSDEDLRRICATVAELVGLLRRSHRTEALQKSGNAQLDQTLAGE